MIYIHIATHCRYKRLEMISCSGYVVFKMQTSIDLKKSKDYYNRKVHKYARIMDDELPVLCLKNFGLITSDPKYKESEIAYICDTTTIVNMLTKPLWSTYRGTGRYHWIFDTVVSTSHWILQLYFDFHHHVACPPRHFDIFLRFH